MASWKIGSSTVCGVKKGKDKLQSFMALSESVKDLFN
jgi:hypothetical protein